MATSPLLFGGSLSPEEMQAQLLNQRATQFAELDPNQQLGMMAYKAGSNVGTGLAGAFGVDVQDPTIRRATKLRELAGQYNTNTAAGLRQMADALRTSDPDMALQLSQKAAAMDLEGAKLESEKALAAQRGREKQASSLEDKTFVELAKKATPASVAAAMKAGNDISLLEIPETVKVSTYGQVLKDAGFKEGTPEFQAKMKAFAEAELKGAEKGRGTKVDISLAGRKEFTEKLAGIDAKRVEIAMSTRDNALATVRSLDQLATLDDQGLISGSFATGRVGATNLLNTLGLTSPSDQQKLASSQNYQKVAGDVILGVLGGKLGAGFSNEDRKFIEGLVPQLETSPAARRQLINFMRRKNMEIADEATRLENYARDKESLKGFTPKFPMAANAPATAMSADDLAKAAGGKIVNGKFVPNK